MWRGEPACGLQRAEGLVPRGAEIGRLGMHSSNQPPPARQLANMSLGLPFGPGSGEDTDDRSHTEKVLLEQRLMEPGEDGGKDCVVNVVLFPQDLRTQCAFPASKPVLMPYRRTATVASLIALLCQDLYKLQRARERIQVRAHGIEAPLPLHAYLENGDVLYVHVLPALQMMAPPPGAADALQCSNWARMAASGKGAPLALKYSGYQPKGIMEWPKPLPPLIILTANERSGFHAPVIADLRVPGVTRAFWVVPNAVIAGDPPQNKTEMNALLEAGVRHFVDLRAPGEGDAYRIKAEVAYNHLLARGGLRGSTSALEFQDHPISAERGEGDSSAVHDQALDDDESLCRLAAQILQLRYAERERVTFIHSASARFRTGSLAALLIGLAYGENGPHSILLYQALHDIANSAFKFKGYGSSACSPVANRPTANGGSGPVGAGAPASPVPSAAGQLPPKALSESTLVHGCRALFEHQRLQILRLLAPERTAQTHALREAQLLEKRKSRKPSSPSSPFVKAPRKAN